MFMGCVQMTMSQMHAQLLNKHKNNDTDVIELSNILCNKILAQAQPVQWPVLAMHQALHKQHRTHPACKLWTEIVDEQVLLLQQVGWLVQILTGLIDQEICHSCSHLNLQSQGVALAYC